MGVYSESMHRLDAEQYDCQGSASCFFWGARCVCKLKLSCLVYIHTILADKIRYHPEPQHHNAQNQRGPLHN